MFEVKDQFGSLNANDSSFGQQRNRRSESVVVIQSDAVADAEIDVDDWIRLNREHSSSSMMPFVMDEVGCGKAIDQWLKDSRGRSGKPLL